MAERIAVRLPIQLTHPFQIFHQIAIAGLSLAFMRFVADLVLPWTDATFVPLNQQRDVWDPWPGSPNELLFLIVGFFLLRCTILPKWLPTWLWCRSAHRVALSADDARKVSFLFDGSKGRWLAKLDLRMLPVTQRLIALRIIANRFATECGVALPFPDVAEAERRQRAERKRMQARASAKPDSEPERAQPASRSDAALTLHLGVLGLSIAPDTFDEVRSAYHRKMRTYHPDLFATELPEVARMASDITQQLNHSFEALKRAYGVCA